VSDAEILNETEALRTERERYRDALDYISGGRFSGPSPSSEWEAIYRKAGGGYGGLQEVAKVALGGKPLGGDDHA
jgi:hypothetical protein